MGNLGDSMGRIFTCLVVTHANIRTSIRSTEPSDSASLLNGTLSYRATSLLIPQVLMLNLFNEEGMRI